MPVKSNDGHLIIHAAIKHRFLARQFALHRAFVDLVDRIRAHVFTRAQLDAINMLGSEWMEHSNRFVRIAHKGNNMCVGLEYPVTPDICPQAAERRDQLLVPYKFTIRYMDVSQEIYDAACGYVKDFRTLEKDVEHARTALSNYLAGFRNLTALAKAWPEGEPFYRGLLVPKVTNLPAVQTEAVNKLFDLPIDEDRTDTPGDTPDGVLDASLAHGVRA